MPADVRLTVREKLCKLQSAQFKVKYAEVTRFPGTPETLSSIFQFALCILHFALRLTNVSRTV